MITGIGQCSLDYLALIDDYPQPDSKKEVAVWEEQGGGPVATALVTLSRLGQQCVLHGIVGDDEAGAKIRDSLVREGVETRLTVRVGCRSQVAFIAVEQSSPRRTIFWKRPTGDPLRQEGLDSDFLAGARFLLLDGLMEEVSRYAAVQAKDRGVPVMLDAGRMRPGMLEIAAQSDYVVASAQFAEDLGWDRSREALAAMRERIGCPVLTITLGKHGSMTATVSETFSVPAFRVREVDTTGAGDVFHGAYVYGLLQNWDLREVVRFASAASAMKCRELGGRRGIPVLSEVRAFLKAGGEGFPSTAR